MDRIALVEKLTRHQKAQLAETVVLSRFILLGWSVYQPVSTWESADWVVDIPNDRRGIRVQVKWIRKDKYGMGSLRLTTLESKINPRHKRYRAGSFDFIVGYNGESDEVHVFSEREVAHLRNCVSIGVHSLERWDKFSRAGLPE